MKQQRLQKTELGKEQDLTKVIVNQQISKLAFQLTLNVRNKVLSAYKILWICQYKLWRKGINMADTTVSNINEGKVI